MEMKLIHLTFIVTWNIQGPDLGIGSCLPLIKMGEDKLLWQRFFRRLLDPFSLSLVSSSPSDQVQKLTSTKFTLTHVVTDWRKALVFYRFVLFAAPLGVFSNRYRVSWTNPPPHYRG